MLLTEEIIDMLRVLHVEGRAPLTLTSRLLVDCDLDSLKLIELITQLKARYGVDFLKAPYSMADLSTPEAIVAAIDRSNRQD